MSDDDDLDFLDDGAADGVDDDGAIAILVVDDEEDVHAVTRLALADFRFEGRSLRLHSARSAAEAERLLDDGLAPAVALVDVVMETPDAGLKLAQAMRRRYGLTEARIVLRTGQPGDAPERRVLLDFDINDYRSKVELTDDRLFAVMLSALRAYGQIAALAEARGELERRVEDRTRDLAQALETLSAYRERLDEELETARETQRTILPGADALATIRTRYGVAIDSRFETSSELGGDFWDVRPLDDDRFALMLVDFAGHGVGAALNTVRMHGLAVSLLDPALSPDAYVAQLNARLQPLLPMGQYATMLFAVVDVARGVIAYTPAGCPAPFVVPADAPAERLAARGFAVGMIPDAVYETIETPFPAGTALLAYSDALFETPLGPDGAPWGEDGLAAAVRAASADGSARCLSNLLARFDRGLNEPLDDDLTCVCLRRAD